MYEIPKGLNIFFDTEFTGLHRGTTLMSIGLVAETGESFYAEFIDYDEDQVDDWIRENVVENMEFDKPFQARGFPDEVEIKNNQLHIKANLERWFGCLLRRHYLEKIVLISDCLAYDWVLFCGLWRGALKVPKYIYYIPFDICTLFMVHGIDPDINRETFVGIDSEEKRKHNARWDAHIIRRCHEELTRTD